MLLAAAVLAELQQRQALPPLDDAGLPDGRRREIRALAVAR
jgi:hypothetical protein